MTRSNTISVLSVVTLFASPLAAQTPYQTPGKVDFRRDIQPLFQEKCISCHGPSQQSAGMRLDQRSSAMAVRGSTMIGPGNATGSVLYLKVSGTRFGQRMPPAGPLDPAQIEAIKNWIDQGAEWPDDPYGDKPPAPPDPAAARLMESLRNGDRQGFERILRENPEAAKRRGPGGTTPLMYAALYGDAASLKQLIDVGADPNVANGAGATALMWAIDNEEKTRFLLEHGADPNAASAEGRTPLVIAIGNHGSAPIVKMLFDHGAKAEAKSFAPAGDDEALLRTLMAHGVDTARLSTGLIHALMANCSACIDLLVKSPSKSSLDSAFVFSPGFHDGSMVKTLLEHGADAKAAQAVTGHTGLMYASESDHASPDIVRTLIEHGADVNAETQDGATALDFALRRGGALVPGLRKAGAKEGNSLPAPVLKPKRADSARAALDRSLPLLQRNDVAFLRSPDALPVTTII